MKVWKYGRFVWRTSGHLTLLLTSSPTSTFCWGRKKNPSTVIDFIFKPSHELGGVWQVPLSPKQRVLCQFHPEHKFTGCLSLPSRERKGLFKQQSGPRPGAKPATLFGTLYSLPKDQRPRAGAGQLSKAPLMAPQDTVSCGNLGVKISILFLNSVTLDRFNYSLVLLFLLLLKNEDSGSI